MAGVDADAQHQLLELERVGGVQLRLAVGVTATQVQAHIERPDPVALLAVLPRYTWVSERLMTAGGGSEIASLDDQTTPDEWGEAETGVARLAVSGVLGTLLLEGRQEDAALVSRKAAELSPALVFQLEEGLPSAGNGDLFATGLASLGKVLGDNFLNAEQLLRATVEIFIWLKHVGAEKLSGRVHAVLSRRWIDLCENHRAILSNPRLSIPAIEAAARHEPGTVAVARLAEAGRLASSLALPVNILEMLRTTA